MKFKVINYTLLSIVTIVTLVIACKKDENEKRMYIRGRLFLWDTIAQQKINVPLGNKKVLLTDTPADTLNFQYSDSTDAQGYFIFDLLDNGRNDFVVRYSDSIHGFHYKGSSSVKRGEDTVALFAHLDTVNLTSAVVTCYDTINGTIPGTIVSFYPSEVMAKISDTTLATLSVKADNYGRAVTFSLKEGKYYVNAIRKADTIIFKKIAQPVSLNKGIINRIPVTLHQ
ncbi:MAG: hypothetical protein ACO1NW_08055 [Chitinophagaceae bacterium]